MHTQITRDDLNYLADLLRRLSYSALSMGEMVIASQLILSLGTLVAKGGGMKRFPNSMQNIGGYINGIRTLCTELANQMGHSKYRQAANTDLNSNVKEEKKDGREPKS